MKRSRAMWSGNAHDLRRRPASRCAWPTVVRIAVPLLLFVSLGACGDGYPPALRADTPPPPIRVLLGRTGNSVRIQVASGDWHLTGGAAGRSGRGRLDMTVALVGETLHVDGRPLGADRLELAVAEVFQLQDRRYPRRLIVRRQGKRLECVNEVDLETYVAGVVGNELGPGAKPATHRAQAIAARTYAYGKITLSGAQDKPWHVYDDARSQVYGGIDIPASYGINYSSMVEATRANRGVVLTWRGRPIHAYYSSTCGGHTTDAKSSDLDPGHASEPLRGVPCPYCAPSSFHSSPKFSWSEEVEDKHLAEALESRGGITLPIHDIQIVERGRGGWAAKVAIVAGPTKFQKTVSGSTFRSLAGLKSHHIAKIERGARPGTWRVEGRGWGHGVGMCQVGAIHMGGRGATETEILRYYYPDVSFTRLY